MKKLIVVLDPGHYTNYNRGIVSTYYEGNAMFKLAQYLKEELEKTGIFEVYLTKNTVGSNPSLANRGNMAITKNADVFISLHTDAYSVNTAVGVSVFYSVEKPGSKELGVKLGNAVTDVMRSSTGVTVFRGCVTKSNSAGNDYYGVIRSATESKTKVPNVFLIEHGFHSNAKECAFLNNDTNLRKIANVEALVLYNHFKVDVERFVVNVPLMGYNNASDAMSDKVSSMIVPMGTYYVYRHFTNGAINITTDPSAKTPGWWINPEKNISPIEIYEVLGNLKGYGNADSAMKNINSIATIVKGTYYVYRHFTNGAINITTDSSAKTPGWWINPNTNMAEKTPEEKEKELDTTGLTEITMSHKNYPEITPQQAIDYINSGTKDYKLTCSLEELVYSFVSAGYTENIRWDIALAQSIHETGFFRYGGQVSYEQNNFSGLGATNDGASGATFKTPFDGALAQIQHLKAYANSNDVLYKENFDPRFKYVPRGWSPYLEWLGAGENPKNEIYGKNIGWAVPGKTYGDSIRKIIDKMKLM